MSDATYPENDQPVPEESTLQKGLNTFNTIKSTVVKGQKIAEIAGVIAPALPFILIGIAAVGVFVLLFKYVSPSPPDVTDLQTICNVLKDTVGQNCIKDAINLAGTKIAPDPSTQGVIGNPTPTYPQ